MATETSDQAVARAKREAAQRRREIAAAMGRVRNSVTNLSSVVSDPSSQPAEALRYLSDVESAVKDLREHLTQKPASGS